MSTWLVIYVLSGCGRAPGIAGCASLDGTALEDCRFEEVKKVAADPAALQATLDAIPDPISKDLALVRLAFDTPSSSAELCARVTTPIGKQRCQQIIGRPHLRGGR